MADSKMTPGNWLSAAGLGVTLLVLGGGLSLYVYATKADLRVVENQCRDKHTGNGSAIQVLQTHQTYQTHELQRVHTRLENISATQQAVSRNVERLLERFRVQAETAPPPKPLPAASTPPPSPAHP